MVEESKNPKDIAAMERCPLHLLPAVGRIHGAEACADGAAKYGPYNWRDESISLMEYTSAIERHLLAYRDGEDIDPKSGCAHLGHIIANAAVILDAQYSSSLIDDRHNFKGKAAFALERYTERYRERNT